MLTHGIVLDFVNQHDGESVVTHFEQLGMIVVALPGHEALFATYFDLHRSNFTQSSVGALKPPESMDGEVMPG